jgi:hypothetical protein
MTGPCSPDPSAGNAATRPAELAAEPSKLFLADGQAAQNTRENA